MATSMELGFEPALLSRIVEKKGTLFLRSDHMKYNKSTLNSDWWNNIMAILSYLLL